MSHGNLDHQLVHATFWPSCATCALFTTCRSAPRHPAYPHRWHWSYEAAHFPEALLIHRSWVGSTVFGQPHTGCTAYTVHPRQLQPLHEKHHRYLTLDAEKQRLEAVFAQLEQKKRWTKREQATFTATFQRYKAVLAEQAELRTTAPLASSPVAAMHG